MRVCTSVCGVLFLIAIWARHINAQDSKAPFTISKETTHVTEPRGEDGLIDYIEALSQRQREGVTTDNNSVVLFRRASGHNELSEEFAEEYFTQLGMEVLPKAGDYLIPDYKFDRSLDASQLPKVSGDGGERKREAQSRPWTRDEFPLVAQWIDVNEKPLAIAVEGSKRPKYFSPMLPNKGTVVAVQLPDIQNSRSMMRLLSARAMLRLGENNVEAAWRDVMACHRIARLNAQGSFLIDFLVAMTIENVACHCDYQIANSDLTSEQAIRFSKELRELGIVGLSATKIDTGERYIFLDAVGKLSVTGVKAMDEITGPGAYGINREAFQRAMLNKQVDWDVVLRTGNESLDRRVAIAKLTPRLKRQPEIARYFTDLQRERAGISRELGMATIRLLSQGKMFEIALFDAEDRCFMCEELSQCAFALAAWRADHGNYPSQLEQLAPKYLKSIPIDTYTGKSLVYRRSDSGFLLYGIGMNLRDDNGFSFGEGDDTDDLVVRSSDEDQRIRAAAKKFNSEN